MTHIILIGFKHTGKSTIGHALSEKLTLPFFDSDTALALMYTASHQEQLNCRQIMKKEGLHAFQLLEHEALKVLLNHPANSIIALGGGTPVYADNQPLIKQHKVVHITAQPDLVFKRILKDGIPAFFQTDTSPKTAFDKLWYERDIVYKALADISISNDGLIGGAVDDLLGKLS